MKKSLLFLLFLSLCFVSVFAQVINVKKAKELKNESVYLILNKNDETRYSEALKNSMEKYWKFNKYEIVYKEELEKKFHGRYVKNVNLIGFFIIDIITTSINFVDFPVFGISEVYKRPGGMLYRYEGKSDFHYYLFWPSIGFSDEEAQAFTDMYVGILNEAFSYVVDPANKVSSKHFNPEDIDKGKGKIYDKKVLFCSKDLYLDQKEIDKSYPHQYEIVSKEEYLKAILERRDVNLYWVFVTGQMYFHYLVNPSTWHIKLFKGDGALETEKAKKKAQIKLLELMNK